MTNVLVRDLDLNLHDHVDARRLEIVADGLPLFGGAQLAIDTTLVSAVRQDGTPRPGATVRDGVALREARRRKERVYHQRQNKYRYRSEIKSKTIGLYQITDVTDLYKIENNKSAKKITDVTERYSFK